MDDAELELNKRALERHYGKKAVDKFIKEGGDVAFESPLMKGAQTEAYRRIDLSQKELETEALNVTCIKCQSTRITYMIEQKRSLDEAPRVNYSCLNCGTQWKKGN